MPTRAPESELPVCLQSTPTNNSLSSSTVTNKTYLILICFVNALKHFQHCALSRLSSTNCPSISKNFFCSNGLNIAGCPSRHHQWLLGHSCQSTNMVCPVLLWLICFLNTAMPDESPPQPPYIQLLYDRKLRYLPRKSAVWGTTGLIPRN